MRIINKLTKANCNEQKKYEEIPKIYTKDAVMDTFHKTDDAVRNKLVLLSNIDVLICTSLPRSEVNLAKPSIVQNIDPPKKPIINDKANEYIFPINEPNTSELALIDVNRHIPPKINPTIIFLFDQKISV